MIPTSAAGQTPTRSRMLHYSYTFPLYCTIILPISLPAMQLIRRRGKLLYSKSVCLQQIKSRERSSDLNIEYPHFLNLDAGAALHEYLSFTLSHAYAFSDTDYIIIAISD